MDERDVQPEGGFSLSLIEAKSRNDIEFWAVLLDTNPVQLLRAMELVGPAVWQVQRYLDHWQREAKRVGPQ